MSAHNADNVVLAIGKLRAIAYDAASMPADLEPMTAREAHALLKERDELRDLLQRLVGAVKKELGVTAAGGDACGAAMTGALALLREHMPDGCECSQLMQPIIDQLQAAIAKRLSTTSTGDRDHV